MKFSIRFLLALMTLVAITAAAMLKPESYWAPLLTNVSVALQLAATVYFCFGRGASRAYAAGFAIGNGFFLLIEFVPLIGKPLIRQLLPWALWGSDSALIVGEHSGDRAYLGSLISGLLYGYGCALLARWLTQKTAS
ncbi:MAG: hypothetical protein ACR2NM_11725 [Bythopirellula sp.]